MRSLFAVEEKIGFGVDRFALGEKSRQNLAWIALAQERTRIPALHAVDQQLDRRAQPYRDRPRLDVGAYARVDERAAAGRKNVRRLGEEAADHAPLAVPEVCFTKALEDLRNTAA